MSKNEILELFLTSLFGTQSEICQALGLDKKKGQPRVSLAFKGEKYSYSVIIQRCEETRTLSGAFIDEIAQRFQKNDEEIIELHKKLLEKALEVDRVTNLFQSYIQKQQPNANIQLEPAGTATH